MRSAALPVVALALAAAAGAAAADQPARQRVVMVSPPAGLVEAVEAALAGWPIELVSAAGQPGATMPAAGEQARALGAQAGARAVVWIAGDGSGHALWVYDLAGRRVAARRLSQGPPFDEPTAAAVALSVKTLLRHSEAAPPLERYGAEAAREALAGEAAATAPAPGLRRERRLRLETIGGARLRSSEASDLELRLGAGLRFSPALLAGRGALVARLRSGTGAAVDQPGFTGRYTDLQLSLGAVARVPAAGRLALVPSAGASLHLTTIDGSIRGQAARARASRVNPSLDGGAGLEAQVGDLVRLSVMVELSYALRRQVYLVAGDPVLTLPRLETEIGAAVSVPLY